MADASSSPVMSTTTLNNTIGSVFLDIVLQAILYGISIVQFYIYFRTESKDQRVTRVLILFIGILSTVLMVFMAIGVYHMLVTDFSSPSALTDLLFWPFTAAYITGVVCNISISGTYTLRLWRLGGKYVVHFVILQVIFDTMSLVSGLAFAIEGTIHPWQSITHKYTWLYLIDLCSLASSDALITVSLCVTLWFMRTGLRKSDTMIRLLMKISIGACISLSVVNITCIITLVSSPNTLIYFIPNGLQPKVAFNALLAFLNSRAFVREAAGSDPVSIHLTQIPSEPGYENSAPEFSFPKVLKH